MVFIIAARPRLIHYFPEGFSVNLSDLYNDEDIMTGGDLIEKAA